MKVTFKDVGQGDSIILEWDTDEGPRIGIIDCNRIDKGNPVADYIRQSGYKVIEFIILSHPHSDHYSGMIGLFEVIEEKNITVKSFAHTLFILGKDFYRYLNWMETDTAALKDLQKMVEQVDILRKKNLILKVDFITENVSMELGADSYLKCLSPSQLEAEKYMEIVNFEPEKNKRKASKAANYLSTMFKLTVGDHYYLFTADTETFSFQRLLRENTHRNLQLKQLKVGQLPHHGSEKNHFPEFWSSLGKIEKPNAVVSAGPHAKYNHPDFGVLRSFHDGGYQIRGTNIINGMGQYLELLKQLAVQSNTLDTFSTLVKTYTNGDVIY